MRNEPPPGFDLQSFFDGIYLFQEWEIFPGMKNKGAKSVPQTMQYLGVPEDLHGLRILDIGPWNGFFSFECARRGASEVVSLGPDDPNLTGYNKVKELLEIENCRYVRASVYDLSPIIGTFDIVLFLGVIYHLRHPLLALDKIFDIVDRSLYVDTPVIDRRVWDNTVPDEIRQKIIAEAAVIHQLPIAYFTKSNETGDPYNWFMPNKRAFHAWVESSGFEIVRSGDIEPNWAWLHAAKRERRFVVNVEGYNPHMSKRGAND